MNKLLLDRIAQAVQSGAIPTPSSGESMDEYKFRTAHAGAIVGIGWYCEQMAEDVAAQAAGDMQGRHSGATVTSPDATVLVGGEDRG